MVNLVWKRKKYPGTSGHQDFPGFSILRYVCVSVVFGAFSVISFHFLQKYRCAPKIGFLADIFIDMFFHFHLSYRCVPKIGLSADISIDICIDISIDDFIDILTDISIDISIDIFSDILTDIFIDISIDILTDKEEGGGRSGLLLKI